MLLIGLPNTGHQILEALGHTVCMFREHPYQFRIIVMKLHNRQVGAGVFACMLTGVVVAGANSSFLDVTITLNNPGAVASPMVIGSTARNVCVSEALSAQVNAQVRVVCTTGRVVAISAMPGKLFLGTHGGAFRYGFVQITPWVSPSIGASHSEADRVTPSTVSSTNAEASDSVESPEMLVIF